MSFTRVKRRVGWQIAGVLLLVAVFALSTPAGAITWGQPDYDHPYGGAILLQWRGVWMEFCSGSLVAPRVFLTAGHCTVFLEELSVPLESLRVSLSRELFAPGATWLEVSAVHTHPDYRWGPQSDPHDVGVLILKEPVTDVVPGRLPSEGFLDALAASGMLKDARFINVGYGADETMSPNRKVVPSTDARMFSVSGFRNLHEAWLYLSQNVHLGNGGTCYGDSGGPTIYRDDAGGETIVAVTSWGDGPCKSTNNNYRVDTASSLAFVWEMIRGNP